MNMQDPWAMDKRQADAAMWDCIEQMRRTGETPDLLARSNECGHVLQTLAHLRSVCKVRGLPMTGDRPELVRRICLDQRATLNRKEPAHAPQG